MHPPFSFRSCRKENGPCTVQKKRTLLVATLHMRAKLLYGGRREMMPAGLRWLPDGRGGVRCGFDSGFPRRGCRRESGCKTAFDQLLFSCLALRRCQDFRHQCSTGSSFRAFRFATRCPGGRGCLYRRANEGIRPYEITDGLPRPVGADALIGPLQKPHQPPASGSEKWSRMYPRLPRVNGLPKGSAFPSLTAARDRQPSPAGGRRSAPAQTDPPNIFSFPPGAAHFLFDVSIWGPRRAPRGGERRSKGAGAVFAAGGNGA